MAKLVWRMKLVAELGVQSSLDGRVAAFDGTLETSFRQIFPNFRSANNPDQTSAAA